MGIVGKKVMTKNFYITLLSLVFISSSAIIQAEYEFTIEQRQSIDSMTIEELKDRKLFIEDKIAQLEDEKENTQNPSTNKTLILLIEFLIYYWKYNSNFSSLVNFRNQFKLTI